MKRLKLHTLFLLSMVALLAMVTGCASKKHLETIDQQKAEIDNANQRIGQLESQLTDLREQLASTSASLEEAQAERRQLSNSITQLNSQISTFEREKADLSTQIEERTGDVDELQSQVGNLNSQITALRAQVADAEALIAEKDSSIAGLEAVRTQLNGRVAELGDQVSTLEDDKAGLADALAAEQASKQSTVTLLSILLGVAVVVAIIGFAGRGRRRK